MKTLALVAAFAALSAPAQIVPQPQVPGDAVLRDFRFANGETLPELKMHYATIGRKLDRKSVV